MSSEERIAKFDEVRGREIWRRAQELQMEVLRLRAENEELKKLIERVGLKRSDVE